MATEDPFPTVVVTPEGVDPDRMRFAERPDFGPEWKIGQVATVFFARKVYWVRWRERAGLFGEVPARRNKARVYHFADVERMIYALLDRGKIDGQRAARCLAVVYACAANYEVPPSPDEDLDIPEIEASQ